jgi:hypothetical protein
MKKTVLSALLLSGVSLFAGEPSLIKLDKGNEFLKEGNTLSFRKAEPKRNILKLKETRFSGSGKDWDEAEVTGGGLFINFGVHFVSDDYMNVDGLLNEFWDYKVGYDFEFGNYFRLAKLQDGLMGLGLRVTWLSASYTGASGDDQLGTKPLHTLELCPLKVGPQFGFAINEMMGVDAFYQLGYNFTSVITSTDGLADNEDIGIYWGYQGLSHEIGAAFHYKKISLGLGYRMGKVKNFQYTYDGETYTDKLYLDEDKRSVNNFRITLGLKF